jgi:hypothetical protein
VVAGRRHCKAFYGTDALLTIDRSGFELVSQERGGRKLAVEKQVKSAKKEHEVVQDHVRGFLECLRSRRTPAADIEVGHLATNPGHLMNIAWRLGRTIKWDARDERATNDPRARELQGKRYRAPWEPPS